MARIETPLMQGWQFAKTVNDLPPAPSDYIPVILPHDWAASASVNAQASLGASQGYFNRNHIGWYRREFSITCTAGEGIRDRQLHLDGF